METSETRKAGRVAGQHQRNKSDVQCRQRHCGSDARCMEEVAQRAIRGIADLSWRQAQAKLDGKEQQAFDEASWLEGRAQNLANDITRAKLHLSKNPEITALALEMLDPGLPAELMAYWEPRRPFDPDVIDEDEFDEDGKPLPF